jgi:hypothetical protein
MAINSTPKEKPTGGGNPTAGGAINDLDFPTAQRPGKAFDVQRADSARAAISEALGALLEAHHVLGRLDVLTERLAEDVTALDGEVVTC